MKLRLFLCFVLGLYSGNLLSQGVLTSRTSSFETHIYKLAEEEAREIHLGKRSLTDTLLFHTLVQSVPTDQFYAPPLSPGYYLYVHTDKNQVRHNLEMIPTCRVELLNNEADLKIQVYDLEGNLVPDAEVRVGRKKLKYDEESESYRKKWANLEGNLEVVYGGMTHFYTVSKSKNPGKFRMLRAGRAMLIPFKLIWIPVRWALFLPVDVVLSVARLQPLGSVITLYKPFRDLGKSIVNGPTGWVGWVQKKFFPGTITSFRNYTTLSKPVYRPKDTLKLRIYAESVTGKPLKKTVRASMYNNEKYFTWNLEPETPGVYLMDLPLDDSLELKLDKSYSINFRYRGREIAKAKFKYEDYELKHAVYKMDIDRKEHFPDVPLTIKASATDENDLPLADVTLELKLSLQDVDNFHLDSAFVPFSLWEHTLDLDPRKQTEFVIPDSIFPPVSLRYQISATMRNANNQVLQQNFLVSYFQKKEDIKWSLDAGKIKMVYLKNDEPTKAQAQLSGYDINNRKITSTWVDLPGAIKINPWVKFYQIDIGNFRTTRNIQVSESGLTPVARRDRDSLYIDVLNQHDIPFSYHVYRLNDEIDAGYGNSLRFREKARNERNHSLSLQYLWGGRIIENHFGMELQEKKLSVSIEQPQTIVPGQEVEMKVKVIDVDGDPVEGADVMSYGLTSKFKDYHPPTVPYTLQDRKRRSVYNHFSMGGFRKDHQTRLLDYNYWNHRFGLDSIPYYQFAYPKMKGYFQEIPIGSDSTGKDSTEFAPFITLNGEIQPISYILINSKPIYFSWSIPLVPYSFPISPNLKPEITIRTRKHQITLSERMYTSGAKTIFSFDLAKLTSDSIKHFEEFQITEVGDTFSSWEMDMLTAYTAAYRGSNEFDMPFFSQRSNLFKAHSSGTTVFGPVFREHLDFEVSDSLLMRFYHEPGYEYDFGGDIPKMRCIDFSRYVKPTSHGRSTFTDRPLKRAQLKREYQAELDHRRRKWLLSELARTTNYGTGELRIKLDSIKGRSPLNTLIIYENDKDDLEMYSGGKYRFTGKESGYYTIMFLLPERKFFKVDSLFVFGGGINFYRLELPDSLKQDSFSEGTSDYLEQFIRQSYPGRYMLRRRHGSEYPRKVKEMYIKNYGNPGEHKLSGRILDEYGEPLPFATIRIKNTSTGAMADAEGKFELFVADGKTVILVNFLGMKTVEKTVEAPCYVEVILEDASVELDEVVVTAGRVYTEKSSALMSVQSISSADMMATRDIDDALSMATGVSIRGARSSESVGSSGSPIYFIDGVKFTGDIADLPKTIVTRKSLTPEEAQKLLGKAGANGAILLTTPEGLRKQKLQDAYQAEYLEALANAKSLRTNFKDDAFWQPALKTNEDGEATFTATFPDDITSWRTFALATRKKGYSGQTEGRIRSFKPIMGKLRLPRFLLPGDSTYVIGKGLNYTPDTLNVVTTFSQDGNDLADQQHRFLLGIVDTNLIVGPKTDTTAITYMLETEDGYADGERRKIPMYPVGVEETVGIFTPIGPDTTFTLNFDPDLGKVTVRAETDLLHVVRSEMKHLWEYGYLCNEQAASKLKAYLLDKRLATLLGEEWGFEEDVKQLIERLEKAQLIKGGWGWWSEKKITPWISRHVTEALIMARDAGFAVNALNTVGLTRVCVYHLETEPDTTGPRFNFDHESINKYRRSIWASNALGYLEILERLKGKVNFQQYISKLEPWLSPNLSSQFRLIRLKQRLGLPYSTQLVNETRQTTLFGNSYWGNDKKYYYSLHYNSISTTALAYQVLKADSASDRLLISIAGYLLEKRTGVYYRNTYESIQVLEILTETLAGSDGKMDKPELVFTGGINMKVDSFPYTQEVENMTQLTVDKNGDFPIYFTAYQRRWEPLPDRDGNNFHVRTWFKGQDSTDLHLTAGNKATLVTEITVDKECDYIMIEVPIPAGATYDSKPQPYWSYGEVHREYFRNKCSIFCTRMTPGKYKYEIPLMPQYTGSYTLNPAKAEMMYFPTFFGREEGKRVYVE